MNVSLRTALIITVMVNHELQHLNDGEKRNDFDLNLKH